jgi:hypothetical protein
MTLSPATEPYGTSAAIAISDTLTYTGALPTGAVAFVLNTVSYPAVCTGAGPATCTATVPAVTVAALPVANYTVTGSLAALGNYTAATATTATFSVTQATQAIKFTPTTPITYGVGSVTLSATGGASGNPVTFALVSGPATLSGSTLGITGAGSIVVTASQAGNTNYAAATPVTATIVVNAAPAAVALTTSQSPALLDTQLFFTATVSSTVGTPPSGEAVTFYDTTTSTTLGTASILNGVATFSYSSLAVGTHAITAIYAGDANFLTSTSPKLSQVIKDFSLVISTTAGSVTSATVPPGGTANYSFTVSMADGSNFPATVTLSATGAPGGSTLTFNPSTIAAGSGSTAVKLSIVAPFLIGANNKHQRNTAPFALALLLLPLAAGLRKSRKHFRKSLSIALFFLAALGASAGLTGCGIPSGYFNQAPQTYTVTVTGTSGTLSHSLPVTLTVE